MQKLPTLELIRNRVKDSLGTLRNDIKRNLNPTPYKVNLIIYYLQNHKFNIYKIFQFQVSVSDNLYNFIHDLWLQNAPIGELS